MSVIQYPGGNHPICLSLHGIGQMLNIEIPVGPVDLLELIGEIPVGPYNPLWGLAEGQYWALGSASIFGVKVPIKIDKARRFLYIFPSDGLDLARLYRSISASLRCPRVNKYRTGFPQWWNDVTRGYAGGVGPFPSSATPMKRNSLLAKLKAASDFLGTLETP